MHKITSFEQLEKLNNGDVVYKYPLSAYFVEFFGPKSDKEYEKFTVSDNKDKTLSLSFEQPHGFIANMPVTTGLIRKKYKNIVDEKLYWIE